MILVFLGGGILLCLALEAFFSGSETGMISLNRIRLSRQVDEGDERAARVQAILEDPSRLLSTTLVGTNLSVVIGTALATLFFSRLNIPEPTSATVTTLVMTPLILVFGEIIPKAVFRRKAGDIMLRAVGPLGIALWLFSLPVAVLSTISRWAIERLGGDTRTGRAPSVTREELEALVRSGVSEGILKPEQESLLRGAFQFSRVSVREAMIPLNEAAVLQQDDSVEQVLRLARETGYTRFPVFTERIDQITGIVNVAEILWHPGEIASMTLAEFVREPLYIPGMVSIDKALLSMQREKERMAVVTNEYGGCDGVLTVDDILEEVVGEFGPSREESPLIQVLSPGVLQVNGQIDLDRFNEEVGLRLPKKNYETLAGFLMARLGRIPREGDKLRFATLHFEILEVKSHTITRVCVKIGKV